jgi:hypothetical protein
MTPQERQLVDDLFDRLAQLEPAARDAEAERAIVEGLKRAPHAVYALVQTVLVQDEALKRAEARIRELGGHETAPEDQGFLDSMREAFTGRVRTSVPSVRPAEAASDTRWNSGRILGAGAPDPQAAPPQAQGGGPSFLGTAAATAAGVIGGSILFNSLGSLFGQRGGSALADVPASNTPWGNSAANSDLAREAGLNDVGRGGHGAVEDPQAAGLFGSDNDYSDDIAGDPGGDGFDGGDSA